MRICLVMFAMMFGSVALAQSPTKYRFEIHLFDGYESQLKESELNKLSVSELKKTPGLKLIAAPVMIVRKDQPGSMQMSPSPRISYLEKTADGTFRLSTHDVGEIGFEMQCETDGQQATIKTKFVSVVGGEDGEIDVLGRRVPIGKPRTDHRAAETKMKVGEHSWSVVEIGKNSKSTLITFRVRAIDG